MARSENRSTDYPVVVADVADRPQRAAVLIATLRDHLRILAERIERIGSTAIRGMDAKDVLDLQVGVADLRVATRALDEPWAPRASSEPCASKITSRPAGPAIPGGGRSALGRGGSIPAVNLHVRRAGSPDERLALLFRDWFRVHPAAVPAYASFKRSLAAITPDICACAEPRLSRRGARCHRPAPRPVTDSNLH